MSDTTEKELSPEEIIALQARDDEEAERIRQELLLRQQARNQHGEAGPSGLNGQQNIADNGEQGSGNVPGRSDIVTNAAGVSVAPLIVSVSAPTTVSAPTIPQVFEQLVPDKAGQNQFQPVTGQFPAWAMTLQQQVNSLTQIAQLSASAVQNLATVQARKESEAKLDWKSKGLRVQYEKNQEFQRHFEDILTFAKTGDLKSIQAAATKGISDISERNKHVRMADTSDLGWAVVDKYTAHPLADDEDDDRKIRKAQKDAQKEKAAKDAKAKAGKKRTRGMAFSGTQSQIGGVKYVGSSRSHGQYQQSTPIPTVGHQQRYRGPSEACFECGAVGHIKRNCPELLKKNKCKCDNVCSCLRVESPVKSRRVSVGEQCVPDISSLSDQNLNVTVHNVEQEHVDSQERFKNVCNGLSGINVQAIPPSFKDIDTIVKQSEDQFLYEINNVDKDSDVNIKNSKSKQGSWDGPDGLNGRKWLMGNEKPQPIVNAKHKYLYSKHIPKVFVAEYHKYESGEGDISVVGRIHVAIPFLLEHKSNPYVVHVLQHGYIPPLISYPPNAIFKNNASARDFIQFVWAEVSHLLDTGAVSETLLLPHIINPLTVAIREDDKKPRLVLDCRFLNLFILKFKIKFEGAETLKPYLQKGGFMINTDLKSGYHAVLINEFYRKLFGFSVIDEWGQERYFYFNSLPFGLTSAGYVFSKILRAWVQIWRDQGIRTVFFLDDGTAVAFEYFRALKHGQIIKRDLVNCGWVPHREKSVWEPRQDGTFLGFVYMLAKAMIKASEAKIERTRSCIQEVRLRSVVPVRKVASVVGKVQSLQLAIGDLVFLKTRWLQRQVAECASWRAKVLLNEEAVGELDFWWHMIHEFNGQCFIENPAAGVLVYSDASATGYAAFTAPPPHNAELVVHRDFSPYEQAESSTFRELTAVAEGLQSLAKFCSSCTVDWKTDSANTAIIIRRGSGIAYLQRLALRVFNICRKNKIQLRVIWIPRGENARADFLSKIVDFDDWEVRHAWFEHICSQWGTPTIDRFASSKNKKVARFNSRFYDNGAEAVDAFTQHWGGEYNYIAPPLYIIPRVIKHAKLCQAFGILVFPVWKASSFWPIIVQEFERRDSGFKDTMILGNIFSQGTQYKSIFSSPHWKSDTYVIFFDYRR